MIDGLKPYPAMKDSGAVWVGNVPEHWVVRKLKYAVSFSGGGTPSKANASFWGGRIPWVSPKDMTRARITDSLDHITEEAVSASAASIVSPGALLMVIRSGILRRTIPVAINAAEVALNQDMKALRPRAGVVASEYLRALVQGNEGILIQEWTKQGATVESIEHEFLANSLVPLPPISEQTAIVRFLDHADRRIRRHIRAKQKLIKLLEEQKQAIIHRAVTRGLDPNVRLKPSGVEWLGEVPEHWEVVALKRVLRRLVDCEHKTAPAVEQSDYRVVRTTAVRNGQLRWSGTYCTSPEAFKNWTQRALPEPGDVIFTREAPAGEACLVPDSAKVCLGQRTVLMKLRREEYDAQFLVHMIYSGPPRLRIQLASQGSTVGHFNMDDIGWMKVLVPPLAEQQSIVAAIARDTASLTEAAERAEREIYLLREYRTRLIADVVTGKLDVREAAARLPQEAEDLEPLDEAEIEDDTEEGDAGDGDGVPEEVET